MKNNHDIQPGNAAEAIKQYVFVLADGLRVTVRAENEYAAARIARQEYCC